ncbi:hypothetical protein HU200_000549 [Digitaria exilis]|uniref:Peptidase A1 domain-containing protein n=1 Tax=Digitaria exilis TaxID=1010633 RepID=A0A835KYD1_9POAL|nr:hypothetical protein HU200_000549 [Digitaria exilis]CAB3489641.1 unnamed protein product [Digitaria exilis]
MATKFLLHTLFISFLLGTAPRGYSERPVLCATMTRSEKTINFTRAACRSHERLSMLAARLANDGRGGDYAMTFSIGTPAQQLSALADTGSDLVWLKCGPCAQCAPQGSPSYYPNTSSSFSKMPCSGGLCGVLKNQSLAACSTGGNECDYLYSYGLSASSHHYTKGYLSTETFTLGSNTVPGIGFGCTTMSEGGYGTVSGLVGLGRGPLSLVSQLKVGAFSYCLKGLNSKRAKEINWEDQGQERFLRHF